MKKWIVILLILFSGCVTYQDVLVEGVIEGEIRWIAKDGEKIPVVDYTIPPDTVIHTRFLFPAKSLKPGNKIYFYDKKKVRRLTNKSKSWKDTRSY